MWGKECGFARARADVRRAKEPDRHSRHVPARVPCPVKLERVAPDYGYQVHIAWTRPIPYEMIINKGSPHDAEGWLYMILGYHGSSQPKIFYIGKDLLYRQGLQQLCIPKVKP